LTHAGEARQEADTIRAELQNRLSSVEEEAQKILDQAATEAQEYERAKREEALRAYQKTISEAREEIEEARQAVLASLHEEVATMAVMAASQVLGRAVDGDEHREMLRDFITKVMALPQVVQELARDSDDSRDAMRVELITAVPLPEELCQSLRQQISQLGKKKDVRLVLREDPDLVGGARLRIDGVYIDDSLSGHLRQMKGFLTENGSHGA
jgi:ATP synthase F0 subunit b